MAPGTRRANRGGYAEHDDFEGLPVRQWREEWVDVAPPELQEGNQKNDRWAGDLFWGMPRDAGLLPQHSQDLLRAARAGRLYKRPAPDEEEHEPDANAEKPEKKEDESKIKGFRVKVWKQVSRNAEGPPISHLAKRRKEDVVRIASKTVTSPTSGATITRAKVRRVDAAGNPYTQEITLQEGQQIDGEIISTTVVAVPSTGEQAQPTPPRNRRPPPPKKNKKLGGPGRGRKKKVLPLPAPVPGQEATPSGEAAPAPPAAVAVAAPTTTAVSSEAKPEIAGDETPVIKTEETPVPEQPDTEMAENDDDAGDEDGDEGDDNEGEGEGGGEDEGNDSQSKAGDQDHEMTDVSPPDSLKASNTSAAESSSSSSHDQRPVPNPLLAPPLNSLQSNSPKLEGSPLKNVVLPSPTTEAPPEIVAPLEPLDAVKAESPPKPEVTPAPNEEAAPVPTEVDTADDQTSKDQEMADAPPTATSQPPVESAEEASEAVSVPPENFIPPSRRVGDIHSPEAASPAMKEEDASSKQPSPPGEVTPAVEAPEASPTEAPPPASEGKVASPADGEGASPPKPLSSEQPVEEEARPEVEPQAEPETEITAEAPVEAPVETIPVPPEADEAAKTDEVPAEPTETAEPDTAKEEARPSPTQVADGPDLFAGLENALNREIAAEPVATAVEAEPAVPEVKTEEAQEQEQEQEPAPADPAPAGEPSPQPRPADSTQPKETDTVVPEADTEQKSPSARPDTKAEVPSEDA